MLIGRKAESEATGHSWRRNLSQVPLPTGGGNTRPPCHPFMEHSPMNLFLDTKWKETLRKGFPSKNVRDGDRYQSGFFTEIFRRKHES
jgi:hypothetical protein